jgi:branched-chain amino acid transport system substrate-binding protein
MRRAAALIATLLLATTACAEDNGGGSSDGDQTGPIRIGAVLDITGAGATLGVPERKTLEMLAKQLNDAGGIDGRQVDLLIEDNQSTEDGAAKAMNKLISSDQVDLVIGASRTGPSLAMRPLAESSRTPMISLAANAKIVDGSQWVFKTAQNDRVVLENIVDQAAAKGWKTLGLARDASGFGEGIEEMLSELGKPKGISVVKTEKFAPDATNFTAQMVNLRNAKADANLIWGIPPAAGLAQKAYHQLGLTAPVVQSHGIGNKAFLDAAGPSANGVLAPLGRMLVADQLPDTDPQKKVIKEFLANFQKTYPGDAPSTFAGHAYDAFQLAKAAFDEVGTDKQKVRDHLEKVQGFAGISGVFTMSPQDHSGLDKHALAIVTVENGAWKLVDENR